VAKVNSVQLILKILGGGGEGEGNSQLMKRSVRGEKERKEYPAKKKLIIYNLNISFDSKHK